MDCASDHPVHSTNTQIAIPQRTALPLVRFTETLPNNRVDEWEMACSRSRLGTHDALPDRAAYFNPTELGE
jgi:hypothetical protein